MLSDFKGKSNIQLRFLARISKRSYSYKILWYPLLFQAARSFIDIISCHKSFVVYIGATARRNVLYGSKLDIQTVAFPPFVWTSLVALTYITVYMLQVLEHNLTGLFDLC